MEYTKDTMQDGTIYERFEGTPEEILQLINRMPQELKGGELGEGINIGKDPSLERIRELAEKVSRELVNGMNSHCSIN